MSQKGHGVIPVALKNRRHNNGEQDCALNTMPANKVKD